MEKSATMHMRKRRVDRCSATFEIGVDEIPWVCSYKYVFGLRGRQVPRLL